MSLNAQDIMVGFEYRMPNGMIDVVVVQIDRNSQRPRVRLEKTAGRTAGSCRWETMEYFCGLNAVRINRRSHG